MTMKEIDYARRCHFPLLLVLVDFAVDDAFWLPIRDEANMHLSGKDQLAADHQSATLKDSRVEFAHRREKAEFLRFSLVRPLSRRECMLSPFFIIFTTNFSAKVASPVTSSVTVTLTMERKRN